MTYEEWLDIYIDETDLGDEEDVVRLIETLRGEAITKNTFFNYAEEKVRELMSKDEYYEWAKETAKRVFMAQTEKLPDGEFKSFIYENWDEITKDEEE